MASVASPALPARHRLILNLGPTPMHNPIRRSRKIGLTQGGRVRDGQAIGKRSRARQQDDIWTRLSERPDDGGIFFITGNPSRDYYHPCSEEDLREVLAHLPRQHWKHLRAVVFRRSTSRDRDRGVEARRRYFCVILYPFPVTNEVDWGTRPPSKLARSHYAPWCDRWEVRDGRHLQVWTAGEVRRYYRYHLFLHEMGHLNQPVFHSLTRREDFAEDYYAWSWARKLGQLPRETTPGGGTGKRARKRAETGDFSDTGVPPNEMGAPPG